MKKIYYYFFVFLLGASTSLTFQPYNLFFLNFIIFPSFLQILFLSKKNNFNINNFFILGCLFGYGFFLSGIYWITISLTFDESFKYLIPIALILIPFLLALFYGFLLIALFPFIKRTINFVLIFSIFFSLMEYLRSTILTGFPWNLIGYTWSWSNESIQILSIIGTYSLGLFSITLYSLPFLFLSNKIKTKEIVFSLFFALLFLSNYFYGLKSLNKSEEIAFNKTKIFIVSPSFNLGRYSSFLNEEEKIKKLIEISEPTDSQKAIYIWPEGILSHNTTNDLAKFKHLFSEFSENHLVVLGANNIVYSEGKKKIYNSLIVVDHEANLIATYNKNKLVPFGEFLPFEKHFRKVGIKKITAGYESFTKGKSRELINLGERFENIKFLPLICYEIIYSGKIKKKNQLPDLVINISEDAWFGKSVGPYQHFSKAIYRSIEEGVFIARSSNKGISAFIDPNGRVIKSLNTGEAGSITFKFPNYNKPTLFSTYSNKIFFLIIFLYILLTLIFRKLKI